MRVSRVAALLALLAAHACAADQDHARAQARMLAEIERDFRATRDLTGLGAMAPEIRATLAKVPRHAFVRESDQDVAYVNRPLSIGHGQTISQPFIVAIMTQLAALTADARVLEIGTGSGYQAAVLAELAHEVYTIEIVEALAEQAARRLAALGYENVHVRHGDGNLGWPDAAPFDAIVVTAAGRLPPALVDQLEPGGRLVIPLDRAGGYQELVVIERTPAGGIAETPVLPVRFVPLTGAN